MSQPQIGVWDAPEPERTSNKTGPATSERGNDMSEFKPAYATQDEDGHWYVIPLEMKDEFLKLLDLSRYESNEHWDEHEAEFIGKFDQYRTGGDLNNKQLFAQFSHPQA